MACHYSHAELTELREGVIWQAENATLFGCDQAVAGEGLHAGRQGERYIVECVLSSTQAPARTVYWVDADTGSVWRTETAFQMAGGTMQIIQDAEPAPDFGLPQPE